MINAEVSKSGNESPLSVIRKFSRKVQGTGLVQNARKRRYYARAASKTVTKKRALKRLARRSAYNKMLKEGKVIEAPSFLFKASRCCSSDSKSSSSPEFTIRRRGVRASK